MPLYFTGQIATYPPFYSANWYLSNIVLNGYIGTNGFGVATSNDGNYVTIADSSDCYLSSNYGQSWNKISTLPKPNCVAMSLDGKYQSLGTNGDALYYSSNNGLLWAKADPLSNHKYTWNGIIMSIDGKYQIATNTNTTANNSIYYSSNYGVNWTASTIVATTGLNFIYGNTSCQYLCATTGGTSNNVYYSTNYGATWTLSSQCPPYSINSIVISASGAYMILTASNGYLYYSTNFGQTWTRNTNIPTSGGIVLSYSMDITGVYQTGVTQTGNIYLSNNTGASWTISNTKLSYDPNYMYNYSFSYNNGAIVILTNYLYYSTDNGASWNKIPFRGGLNNWYDIGKYYITLPSYNVNFMLVVSQTNKVLAINNLYYGGSYVFV